MRIRTLATALVVACCATAAQAGAVFGSSATSTFSSPIIQKIGVDGDMDSAPDGVRSQFRNNTKQTGAQTFTVSWNVTGAGANISWRLFVVGRTDTRTSITGVQITDNLGKTASSSNSLVISTGVVLASTITTFELTGFQAQGDYGTVQSGFNWANVQGLLITFQLDNPVGTGVRTTINIDAVANPEPTTLALFGLGLLGLGTVVRRRRRRFAKSA